MTLRQIMDVAEYGILFRIKDPHDDEKVVFSTDYMLKDEGVISVIADLLDVGVSKIYVGVSEDPISPRETLPTVWVELNGGEQ